MKYENPYARSFRELQVYKDSVFLARDLYRISLGFPAEERYGLTDQMRRASRSVGAQIAEAWGKRRFEKSFIAKLVDADGEQMETQHWILIATSCGYISKDDQRELRKKCEDIGRMLNGMIFKSAKFCQPQPLRLSEEPGEYLVEVYDEANQPEDDSGDDLDDDWLFDSDLLAESTDSSADV